MQPVNEEIFKRYYKERIANEIKPSTLRNDRLVLKNLDKFLGKPFQATSKEDMIGFLAFLQTKLEVSTFHTWKAKIKFFYNWLYGLDPREYPACVKWIRSRNPRRGTKTKGYKMRVNPEDVLVDEDVKLLIESCDHPRDQALVMVAYETAAEPLEALNMKVKSVQFDRLGAVVTLEGSELLVSRRLRVVDSIPYLQAWLNVHPLRKNEEAPLWLLRKGQLKGMAYHALWKLLRKLKKKSGLKKPLSPNLLRHGCLTKMAGVLPEQKLKKFAGWTPASRMASVYVHLAGKDLDEDILRLHGKAVAEETTFEKSPLEPIECPRCKFENPATHLVCVHCGMILDQETAVEMDPLLRDIQTLSQIPAVREYFQSIVEDAKVKLAEMLKLEKGK